MRLLVDIGNSRLKWATLDTGGIGPASSAEHRGREWDALLSSLWRDYPPDAITVIWAANVAGPAPAAGLTAWAARHWPAAEVRFVRATARAGGVRNAYPAPERLGVDRWAALVAARRVCAGACCIADCGTAVTLDVLAADGMHRGGLIVPGLAAMRGALRQSAHALQDLPAPENPGTLGWLARDTQSGVKIGTVCAVAALIDSVVETMRREENSNFVQCVLTGGDAPAVLPWLRCECRHLPDLVLQGIAILAGESTCV